MLDLKPWTKAGERTRHLTWALMFGTWWNDDPLMSTWGEGADISDGLWRLYTSITQDREKYPGGVATCKGIRDFVPKDVHLARQSHYGSMQHLHFMTNRRTPRPDSEEDRLARIEETRKNALKWMEFAYSVAKGEIGASASLTPLMEADLGLPSIAANHCVQDPANVKVRTLFARLGMEIRIRDQITPDVALGSMLHVVQDSFSPAHTCRVGVVDAGHKRALLKDVFNYSEQVESAHAKLDVYPDWLNELARGKGHRYENDPVAVGQWLIAAVDKRLEWDVVRNYLERMAFAAVDPKLSEAKLPCIGLAD